MEGVPCQTRMVKEMLSGINYVPFYSTYKTRKTINQYMLELREAVYGHEIGRLWAWGNANVDPSSLDSFRAMTAGRISVKQNVLELTRTPLR